MGVGMKLRKDSPATTASRRDRLPRRSGASSVGARTQLGRAPGGRQARDPRPAGRGADAAGHLGQADRHRSSSSSAPSTSATWPRPCPRSCTSRSSTCHSRRRRPRRSSSAREREPASHLAVPGRSTTTASRSPSPTRTPSWPRSSPTPAAASSASSSRPRSDIQRAIDTAYRALGNIQQHVRDFEETDESPAAPRSTPACSRRIADDAPVVQVVNLIITQALRDRASDIHIEPQDERPAGPVPHRRRPARRRRRCPSAMAPALVSRLKIMAGMNIVERRRPQDGQITMRGRRPRDRHPGLDGGHRSGARTASCGCSTRAGRCSSMGDLGMPARHPRASSRRIIRSPVRHGAVRRADRERQDDDAVRDADRDRRPAAATS